MAANLLVTFPQLVSLISRKDFDEIKNFDIDLTPFETEEFKKKLEDSEYYKEKYDWLSKNKITLEFLQSMNTHANVSVNVCVKGVGAVEVAVSGEDLGELGHFLAKAVSYRKIIRTIEDLNEL